MEPSSPVENDVREPDCVSASSLCGGERRMMNAPKSKLRLPNKSELENEISIKNFINQQQRTDVKQETNKITGNGAQRRINGCY